MPNDSTFTQTGVAELRREIDTFPAAVTETCKSVARTWAGRVKVDAQARLRAQTKGEGNTAAALQVTEDAPNKQYIVGYGLIRNRPANLPLWLEYGTVRMTARPHMRPAAEAARVGYAREMDTAVVALAQDTFR